MPTGDGKEVIFYYQDAEGKYREIPGPIEETDFSFTMEDLWQQGDPPRDGWYIVTIGRVVGVCIWEAGKWWLSPHNETDEVTAWMPVPKPYREALN